MSRRSTPRPKGRLRVRWIAIFLLVLTAAAAGGYGLFRIQKNRITQRLLAEAKTADQNGDTEKAIQSYRLYLARNGADVESLRAYGDLLHQQLAKSPEHLGDAVRAMRQLLRLEPANATVLERLVHLYLDLNEYGLAVELGKTWTSIAPASVEATLALAHGFHGLQKYDEAVQLLLAACERAPTEPRFYPPLIDLLSERLERRDEAAKWLDRALKGLPDSHEVRMAAFAFELRRGDAASAETHLQRALALAPDDANVLLAAAEYFIATHRLAEAEKLTERLAASIPGDRRLVVARIAIALRRNDHAAMTALADEVLNTADPADRNLVIQAAELYVRSGALAKSDDCIKRLADDPRLDESSKTSLETLRGARALMGGEPFTALAHLQNALRMQPNGLWAMELLAKALLDIGAEDEAADLYRRLSQQAPGETIPRLALARIELQRNRVAAAREQLLAIKTAVPSEMRQVALLGIAADLRQSAIDGKLPSDCADCRERLARIAADNPTDFASVELLARCFVEADDFQSAWAVLAGRSGDSAAIRGVIVELARRLIDGGHEGVVNQWTDELLATQPDAVEANELRVESLVAAGRVEEAQRFIDQCNVGPEPKSRLWIAFARRLSSADVAKNADTAVTALQSAAKLVPRDMTVRQELVRRLKNPDDAEKVLAEMRAIEGDAGVHWKFERASMLLRLRPNDQTGAECAMLLKDCLAARPGWTTARSLLGFAQELTGAFSEAADSYRAAIAQRPELATDSVAVRLLEMLKRLGRNGEADAVLTPLAAAKPDSPDVLRLVTDRQVRQKDVAGAAATAERALALTPDDPAWAAATADLLLRSGQAAKAEQLARASLETHPESVSLLTSLSQALFALDRADEAEQLARTTAAERKSAPFDLLLARVLLGRKKAEEARSVVEEVLMREPDNASLHAIAADFWGSQGNRARQLELTRKAVVLRGESPKSSLVLAALLAAGPQSAERDEALAIIRTRLAEQPDDARALVLEAQLMLTAAPPDPVSAEALLTKAIRSDAQSPAAYKLLSAVQLQTGQLSAAGETAAAGLARAPDDVELLMLSAEIHQQRGQYDRSLGPLHRLLGLQPGLAGPLELFTTAMQRTGQANKGIETISRLSPDETRPSGQSILLAKLCESKGDFIEAEKHFRRAVVTDQAAPAAFREYMFYQARRGSFDQVYSLASKYREDHPTDIETVAIAAELLAAQSPDEDFRRRGFEWLADIAIQFPDRAADASYRSGMCRFQRGEFAEAEKDLLRASQLAPDSANPVNALAWLYGEELNRVTDGLAAIDAFLQSGGKPTAEMLDTHGVLLFRQKRFDLARQQFRACLAVVGTSPTRTAALYHLGLLQLETGSMEEGAAHIRQAVEMNERVGGLNPREEVTARQLLKAP